MLFVKMSRPRPRSRKAALAGAAAIVAVGGILYLARPDSPGLPTIDLPPVESSEPPMCPWREPESDLKRFFPSADDYRTDTLALSSIRQPILARLGPGGKIESNSLYVHRALQNGKPVGTLLVRRLPGPHGAIELVLAVDLFDRVAGLRIQRHREPERTAKHLTSAAFERRFRGLTAESVLPVDSRRAGEAGLGLANAVRTMLIELDEAERHYAGDAARHH